jgi:hypothetical protein
MTTSSWRGIPRRDRRRRETPQGGGSLILEPAQEAGLNTNMATIVANFTSHWGTGQALAFTAPAARRHERDRSILRLLYFRPDPGDPRKLYKSLSQKL